MLITTSVFSYSPQPYLEPPARIKQLEKEAGLKEGTFFWLGHGKSRTLNSDGAAPTV